MRRSVCAIVTVALVVITGRMASADALEDRVVAACGRLYIEGISAEIAAAEVGREGVPVLLRLLADPAFRRRDNVVAFLWHLGGPESTDALVHAIESPAGSVDAPEEDRALLLAPQALGHIARRGDARALEALLAMTDPDGDGGAIGRSAVRGRDAARYRRDLRERAYRGLAVSNAPAARTRLADLAKGRRAAADPARARAAREALGSSDAASSGTSSDTVVSPPAAVEPLLDGQARAHDTPITYSNHVDMGASGMRDRDLDHILASASLALGRADFSGDVSCCVELHRSGTAGTFGTSGDGLDVIDDQPDFYAVVGSDGRRAHVVRAILWCGGTLPNVLGCANLGGSAWQSFGLDSMHWSGRTSTGTTQV